MQPQPKKSRSRSKASRAAAAAAEAAAAEIERERNANDPGGGGGGGGLKALGAHYPPPPASSQDYHGQYIKTEPGLLPPPPGGQPNKMEGYERNYQNFIQYADFCQNDGQGQPVQQHQHQHQHQQDYAGYHHNSAYYGAGAGSFQQNFQQSFVPGYQAAAAYGSRGKPPSNAAHHGAHGHGHGHGHGNSMLELDRKPDTNSIIPLPTNYEKDIPAHAYPIPAHRYALGHGGPPPPHLSHHGMLEPKLEDMGMLGHGHGHGHGHGYAYLGEGKPINNGFSCCRQGGTRPPTAEHLKDGTCLGLGIQPKEELLDEEEMAEAHNGVKAKSKKQKQDEIPEIIVKHEKINPMFDTTDRLEKGNKTEIPECECFQSDKNPPEPGTYYTHLGK